jgi:acetyl-CoA acetyltransferase
VTRFGRRPDTHIVSLTVEASRAALADAGIVPAHVDAVELGTFLARTLRRRGVLASAVAQRLGIGPVRTTAVEGACSSGGIALRHGLLACRAGAARTVLCLGVEHMTGVPTPHATAALGEAFDGEARRSG